MKRWLLICAAAALLFAACGGGTTSNSDDPHNPQNPGTGTDYATGVNVNPNPSRLYKLSANPDPEKMPETIQLNATVFPVSLSDEKKTVTWTSSDENVATVNAATGLVTAVGGGEATITAATSAVTLANGSPATGSATVRVLTTDIALFRWSAETDSGFNVDDVIQLYEWRTVGGSTIMAMGQDAKAVVSKNGKKGYLLNALGDGPRDPATGLHSPDPTDPNVVVDPITGVARDPTKRSGNGRLVIGCTDSGYDSPDEVNPDTGLPVRVGLTNANWAPEGTLNLYQRVRITLEFSDMTSGVESDGTPAAQYGFQIWVLNTTTTSASSPMSSSRILSDNPASPPPEGDGEATVIFTGPNQVGSSGQSPSEMQAYLENGFISIHSGYGRQVIIRSILIEPLD